MSELRIISAMYPMKFPDDCMIMLKVWFEGIAEPQDYVADPFDKEPHGRELWFRAMMGEYGQIAIFPFPRPPTLGMLPSQRPTIPEHMKNESMLRCLTDIREHRRRLAAEKLKALPEGKNDG